MFSICSSITALMHLDVPRYPSPQQESYMQQNAIPKGAGAASAWSVSSQKLLAFEMPISCAARCAGVKRGRERRDL